MTKQFFTTTLALAFCAGCSQSPSQKESLSTDSKNELYLTVGTYNLSAKADTAIWMYRFDTENGTFRKVSGFTGINNPSFLTWSPNGKELYAVSENGANESRLNALRFDATNETLSLLNSQPTAGIGPCYVAVSADNRFAVTAEYSGGSISVFPILPDGKLGKRTQEFKYTGSGYHPTRQEAPHLHTVRFTKDNRYLLATDLGLDRIYQFRVTSNDSLFLEPDTTATTLLAPGSGPRHLAFAPDSSFIYLINELSGMVTLFKPEGDKLIQQQEIAADTLQAAGSADIHISPDGKFLYASNRLKGDGIAIFRIHPDGSLTKAGYQPTGRHPRNFAITPNGKYLLTACRDDNRVEIFKINPATGLLSLQPQTIRIPAPVCLIFSPLE